ncbi:vitamin K epoxide reductase family protein, partial [Parasynechococcus sp.]|uniref:vitamin K epoxide reductase family protein n=1 Tax=Parasynechococcus sp. TaxID=3101203 RepID=UPI003704AAEB
MGSSRLVSRRRQDSGAKWARIAMAVLATVGVIDTGTITLKRWGLLGDLICPMGTDGCDKVLNSPWGTIAEGIPLSFVGLLAYGAVLLMALLPLLPGLNENKTDLSRRTWWGLFTVSIGMAVFSGVLLGLMVFKIQAFCFFCLLSGILSLLLLILSVVGGGWDDPGQLIFRGVLLALAVLLGGLIWASVLDPDRAELPTGEGVAPLVTSESSPAAVALADHLTSGGAVMYSAYWCPHCHEQKELFGKEASAKLNVVECAADGENNQADLCRSKGLEGFPSWEIKGTIESGVQSL